MCIHYPSARSRVLVVRNVLLLCTWPRSTCTFLEEWNQTNVARGQLNHTSNLGGRVSIPQPRWRTQSHSRRYLGGPPPSHPDYQLHAGVIGIMAYPDSEVSNLRPPALVGNLPWRHSLRTSQRPRRSLFQPALSRESTWLSNRFLELVMLGKMHPPLSTKVFLLLSLCCSNGPGPKSRQRGRSHSKDQPGQPHAQPTPPSWSEAEPFRRLGDLERPQNSAP